MKDIFFGCSKQIARYGYLRRDVDHMKKLQSNINDSKVIIFNNRHNKSKRLEILLHSEEPNRRAGLSYLNVKDFDIFKSLLSKWLLFNAEMQEFVTLKKIMAYNDINEELKKVSIFWLGFDDMNVTRGRTGDSVYSIDISNSDVLCEFVESKLLPGGNYRYSTDRADILNLENEDSTLYAYSKMYIDFLKKNNFCAGCGGHVVPVELGSRLYCLNDSAFADGEKCTVNFTSNNLQYPRTDPVVIISLYDERGRILLGNSKKKPAAVEQVVDKESGKMVEKRKKMYSCFAGFMEPGETIEHACMREVYEETGLRVNEHDIRIVESQPWPFPANLMIGCVGIVSNSESADSKINITLDNEMNDVRWFDSNDVSKVLKNASNGVLSTSDSLIEEWYCPTFESVAGRIISKTIASCDSIKNKL